jgi:hypothetical protein
MSSRATKSFSWLWIATLLTATVGVSVQRMYCYCVGATTISFFTAGDPCLADQRTDDFDCCPKPPSRPVQSCCEQPTDTCSAGEHDGCMEKSTKVFQLKTEFLVDKPFEKTFDCPLWIEKMPMFRRYFRPALCEVVYFGKPPPPPLSGRDISLRHQLFRC